MTPSMSPPGVITSMTPNNVAMSVGGEPLVYPATLLIRNTFIEVQGERPFALDDFFEERLVRSCPASGIDSGNDASAAAGERHAALTKTAATSCPDPEGYSECSTVASLESGTAKGANLPWRRNQAWATAGDYGECRKITNQSSDATRPYTTSVRPTPMNATVRLESMLPLPMHMVDTDVATGFDGYHGRGSFGPSDEFPSRGSFGHNNGVCKPCAFFHVKGCENGFECPFCHLCDPGEKKKRRKEKQSLRKDVQDGHKQGQIPFMTRLSGGARTAVAAGRLL